MDPTDSVTNNSAAVTWVHSTNSLTQSEKSENNTLVDETSQSRETYPMSKDENLMSLSSSDSSSPVNPQSESTDSETLKYLSVACDNTINTASVTDVSEAVNLIDLEVEESFKGQCNVDSDKILSVDPFDCIHGNTAGTEFHMSHSSSGELKEKNCTGSGQYKTRKRSKTASFPLVKQKEGAQLTEDVLSKSLPLGQLSLGNSGLIEFVADDLQEKIRRSSPLSRTGSEATSSRRSSNLSLTSADSVASSSMATSSMATSMTSGMSQSYPQSPDFIPPIDPMAIHEIENQARMVADNVHAMMQTLQNNLHKMSAISVGCEEAYKTSVDVTCDSVDASIKSMYALMAKCEELTQTMLPVYKLADQIKDINRLLDRFERQLDSKH